MGLPEKPYRLVGLADALMPYSEALPFTGALLWIRQWGVWNETDEKIGSRVMEVVRRIHGETVSMDESPGYLFGEQELIDLQVCFVQPLLIGWDAFLIPQSADYIVATSHDETTSVLSRTAETHARIRAELQPWNAREDSQRYFQGTNIPTI